MNYTVLLFAILTHPTPVVVALHENYYPVELAIVAQHLVYTAEREIAKVVYKIVVSNTLIPRGYERGVHLFHTGERPVGILDYIGVAEVVVGSNEDHCATPWSITLCH